jgi:CDP-glycerol glycerophosphotransferase (TagB/SpsB family)
MSPQVHVARILRFVLRFIYAPLKLLPTQRKVVMISRQSDSTPQDFALLRDAIGRSDATVKVVILAKMIHPGILSKISYALHLLTQLYQVATARALVLDTYSIVASLLNHKRSLTVIQMWHAVSAFKKFSLSILDQPEGRDGKLAKAMRMHAGYDIVLAGGEAARAPFAEAFGIQPEKIVVAPLPRVDLLIDPAEANAARERVFAAHPHLRGERVALYAPTYRIVDGVHVAADVDAKALTEEMNSIGFRTVVKLHPLTQTDLGPNVETANGISTQDLLHVAELFITDYSSTIFEAAVLGIPSCFLAPDLDEYLATRDFYLDYAHDLPGPLTKTIPELVATISRGEANAAKVREFAKRWVQVPDDGSAQPCANQISRLVLSALNSSSGKIKE